MSYLSGTSALNSKQLTDSGFTPTANFGTGSYGLIAFTSTSGSFGARSNGTIDGLSGNAHRRKATISCSASCPSHRRRALLAVFALSLAGYGWRRRRTATELPGPALANRPPRPPCPSLRMRLTDGARHEGRLLTNSFLPCFFQIVALFFVLNFEFTTLC